MAKLIITFIFICVHTWSRWTRIDVCTKFYVSILPLAFPPFIICRALHLKSCSITGIECFVYLPRRFFRYFPFSRYYSADFAILQRQSIVFGDFSRSFPRYFHPVELFMKCMRMFSLIFSFEILVDFGLAKCEVQRI